MLAQTFIESMLLLFKWQKQSPRLGCHRQTYAEIVEGKNLDAQNHLWQEFLTQPGL